MLTSSGTHSRTEKYKELGLSALKRSLAPSHPIFPLPSLRQTGRRASDEIGWYTMYHAALTLSIPGGRVYAMLEVEQILGVSNAWLGVGDRLTTQSTLVVIVVEVVRLFEWTRYGQRRVWNQPTTIDDYNRSRLFYNDNYYYYRKPHDEFTLDRFFGTSTRQGIARKKLSGGLDLGA